MSDQTSVAVDVVANTGGVRAGMRDGATAVSSGVQQMRDALLRLGGAANDNAKHFSSFSDKLRDFKSEQVQQGRAASFFASQLIEIIPGADGAKAALQGLIGIGLEGFGFGLAFESAIFLLARLKDATESEDLAARKLKSAFDETFSGAVAAMLQVQDALRGPKSKTEAGWEKQLKDASERVAVLRKEIQALQEPGLLGQIGNLFGPSDEEFNRLKEVAAIRRGLNQAKPVRDVTAADERATQHADVDIKIRSMEAALADEVVRLNNEKEDKLHDLDRRRDLDVNDSSKLRVAIEADTAEKIRRLREDHLNEYRSLERTVVAALGNDVQQIQADTANRISELRIRLSRTTDEKEQQILRARINAESILGDRKVDLAQAADQRIVANQLAAAEKMKSERIERMFKEEREVEALRQSLDDERFGKEFAQSAEEIRKQAQLQKDHWRELQRDGLLTFTEMQQKLAKIDRKMGEDLANAWRQAHPAIDSIIGSLETGVSGAIRDMIHGAKDFGEALKDVALGAVDALIDGLVKLAVQALITESISNSLSRKRSIEQVVQASGVGGANAAAQAAAIPFVGPFIAVETGLAMAAAIVGAFTPMAAASGGFDVPAFSNPVTQIHAKEMVLPADLAEGARRTFRMGGAEDGGGGGEHYHFHFPHAVVADAAGIRRLVESGAFQRATREARRNGLSE